MENLKFNAEFASDVMKVIPSGYIDKTICGCGLSTVALENNVDTIITVPSVELIRNKVAQYPNDRSDKIVFGVYGGVTKEDIEEYCKSSKVLKIMVTYDSLHKVEYLLDRCHLVVDESNKLLSSSRLKSTNKSSVKSIDITTQVFDIAYKYKNTVSFISATPTPLEYMPKWVSEINQIKIEWANTIKAKPILMERTYPYKSVATEILEPLRLNNALNLNGVIITKVIVFMNSVESIIRSIKEAQLDFEDVAIIASNSIENDIKIKGYNRLVNPKKLPKYTFVTSSGFEGIDLEDSEAISVVVSNTSKSYQMIDILTDLKQAISRQRIKTNPNYDKFIYIYNQCLFTKTSDDLIKELDEKSKSLDEAIYLWEIAKKENKKSGFKYTETNADFVAYTNYIAETETYILNKNLFEADKYFILNIKEQYRSGFDIKASYEQYSVVQAPKLIRNVTYEDMVDIYNETGNIEDYTYKAEYYHIITESIKLYKKVWKDQTYAKQMIENYGNEYAQIILAIRDNFVQNTKYSVSEVKLILKGIYEDFGLKRIAKSTDLQEFMLVKEYKSNGNRYVQIINKNKTIK